MIDVYRVPDGDGPRCACNATAQIATVVEVSGGDSIATHLCTACVRKLINALAFMYCSITGDSIGKLVGLTTSGKLVGLTTSGKPRRAKR